MEEKSQEKKNAIIRGSKQKRKKSSIGKENNKGKLRKKYQRQIEVKAFLAIQNER